MPGIGKRTPPSEAVQVAVLADLCDAVDPRLTGEQRDDALVRAMGASLTLTVAGLVTNLSWLLGYIRDEVGEQAVVQAMSELRANIGNMVDLYSWRRHD